MPPPPDADTAAKRGYDFVAGMVGGTLATLANTPFDVVSKSLSAVTSDKSRGWYSPGCVQVAVS